MLRTMAAIAALVAVSGAAEAARLVTAPIASTPQEGSYDCAIEYLGTSTAPITVQITAKLAGRVKWQVRRSVKASSSAA